MPSVQPLFHHVLFLPRGMDCKGEGQTLTNGQASLLPALVTHTSGAPGQTM